MLGDEQLLTAQQVANMMQIHIQTVRGWVNNGELAVVWIGKREYRIRRSVLESFILSREKKKNINEK
ncbi:helix-turn-helix domain-containing protein [Ktedonospora formicarum]|uniref:Helix-turn-helix domain-containing protein n=1 Tax=Ktedonospora formicarum TaxID=2778364 RepID=A0A8J3MU04_9CHLR|nr:helix-turn-helix domain-containing protein [Ktedonospora formicarum]GHO44930.1 hypothetical protein KSX_30930 [Ktedonospora formicarum]